MQISPDNKDIASGHSQGRIKIHDNLIPSLIRYFDQPPESKTETLHPHSVCLIRNLHWHAHAVTSLSYQPGNILYSGGEESVLAVWQLGRGIQKPSGVLPRIAKGGIIHLDVRSSEDTDNPGILVCCEDNTLQYFHVYNRNLIWKMQGLAKQCRDMEYCNNRELVLYGLEGAPGYIQWFDTFTQRVTATLEVAPFNRVSRMDREDDPMPQPRVTCVSFSEDKEDLVTIEEVPTENTSVGFQEMIGRTMIGMTTAIKFWTKMPDEPQPYLVTATMAFPHGERCRVSAVAMSPNGKFVCSVSRAENNFRIWTQGWQEEDNGTGRIPVWICQYKVSTPSGYANYRTSRKGLAFSPDGSVLAISYGHMIALWDYRNASLIHSLQHPVEEQIESLQFVKSDLVRDMILTRSRSAVKLQSPYGKNCSLGWSYGLPSIECDADGGRNGKGKDHHCDDVPYITDVQVINESVAIAVFFGKECMTNIGFVELANGKTTTSSGGVGGNVLEVRGKVAVLCTGCERTNARSRFVPAGSAALPLERPLVRLFCQMESGKLIKIEEEKEGRRDEMEAEMEMETNKEDEEVPTIFIPKSKRVLEDDEVSVDDDDDDDDVVPFVGMKRSAMSVFMGDTGADDDDDDDDDDNRVHGGDGFVGSSELPQLSGGFLRAFVGRNLRRKATKRSLGD